MSRSKLLITVAATLALTLALGVAALAHWTPGDNWKHAGDACGVHTNIVTDGYIDGATYSTQLGHKAKFQMTVPLLPWGKELIEEWTRRIYYDGTITPWTKGHSWYSGGTIYVGNCSGF